MTLGQQNTLHNIILEEAEGEEHQFLGNITIHFLMKYKATKHTKAFIFYVYNLILWTANTTYILNAFTGQSNLVGLEYTSKAAGYNVNS